MLCDNKAETWSVFVLSLVVETRYVEKKNNTQPRWNFSTKAVLESTGI